MKRRKNPAVAAAAFAAATLGAAPAARAAAPDSPPAEPAPDATTTTAAPETTTTTAAPPTTTTPTTTAAPKPSTTAPTTTKPSTSTPSTSTPKTTEAPSTTTGSASSTSAPTNTDTATTIPQPGTATTAPDASDDSVATTVVPDSTIVPGTTVPPNTLPPAPAQLGVQVPIGGDYGAILLTIRTLESGNRYEIGKNAGGASGAYQFIDRTWNNFGGYPSAYLAPPVVQDQKALADVQKFLAQWGGDVSMVPVMWYYPKAAYNPALMDQVPMPGAGNTLTIREYQHKWMRLYQRFSGKDIDLSLYEPGAIRDRVGLPPLVTGGVGELQQVAFPVLGPSAVSPAPECEGPDCEPGTDAVVWGKRLQPVLTAFEGVVTDVERGDPATGEVSVTVTDRIGRTYTYTGFNSAVDEDGNINEALSLSANARIGVTVRAGTILGFMGNSDPTVVAATPDASTPADGQDPNPSHIRLTIRDQHGTRLDAVRLVNEALEREACRIDIGPWSMPANALIGNDPNFPAFEPVRVEVSEFGSFKIESDGTVNAIGDAALVVPAAGCEWAPELPFGPGVGGEPMPEELREPIELPLSMYIASAEDGTAGRFGIR